MVPHSLLQQLPSVEPQKELLDRILSRIYTARIRRIYFRLAFALSGMLAAVALAAIDRSLIGSELRESSLWTLLQLLVSDSDIMLVSLRDVAQGILEMLPLESMILSLLFGCSMLSVLAIFRTLRKARCAPFSQYSF